jgi:HEAT repeat protein
VVKLATILLLSSALLSAQTAAPADPKQRAASARDAAKQGVDGIPVLTTLSRDASIEVRVEAVKQLNTVGGPRTLNALTVAANDADPEVQMHAIDGLINIFLPGYLKSGLARATTRTPDGIRVKPNDPGDFVVEGFVTVAPEAITALTQALKSSKNFDVRANAARALGMFRASAAVQPLSEALYSKNDALMYESLIAIQKIRDASAGPGVAFLVRDLNPKIQLAALKTAGILRARNAGPNIRTVIDDQPSLAATRAAVEALAMIADPADRGLFLRFLDHKDAELRGAAAEGLARLHNAGDTERLTKAFNDEREYSPRLSMAFALVSLGRMEINDLSPFRYLINSLNRASFRNVTLAFLTELARESAARLTIYPNLDRATKDEKTGLCVVFGESGQQDSVPYLNRLKDDKDPEVAQACLRSLRTLEARLK